MGKEKYIVTIKKEDGERVFVATKGERIMMKDRTFIVVGDTPLDQLPPNVKMEELTKENKFKVKKIKKLTKN